MANSKPKIYSTYDDCPDFLRDFLYYMQTIRGLSARSVESYYIDLKLFLRFIWQKRNDCIDNETIQNVKIHNFEFDMLHTITQSDVLDFLYFVMNERGNSTNARARKLSSLRGFFKYMTKKTHQLDSNPCENIELPQKKQRLPKYLSLEQCQELLTNVNTDFPTRDFCILMLFLNCGMRLSELVGIDLLDIREDTLRIIGKGDKERTVYLNQGCLDALEAYIEERNKLISPTLEPALFISKRLKKRLSARRVEQIVTDCLKQAGLDGQGYSAHKLRHTAATLLYRSGNADMLALKEILGHEHVSTTEIYTHISDDALMKAAKGSPLASFKRPEEKKKTDEEE